MFCPKGIGAGVAGTHGTLSCQKCNCQKKKIVDKCRSTVYLFHVYDSTYSVLLFPVVYSEEKKLLLSVSGNLQYIETAVVGVDCCSTLIGGA